MLTRVQRNKKYKKSKRRFRLFISVIIIIAFISIIHVNNSYNTLLDSTEVNQIFSIEKVKDRTDIVLLGKRIGISNEYILQGKEFSQKIGSHALDWINNLIAR